MPRGERHFETGRCYGKKEPSELMPTNDGWRVESCPPVANGPVITSIQFENQSEDGNRNGNPGYEVGY